MAMTTGASSADGSAGAGRDLIGSLQVMRGVAAIAVAIYHTHLILARPEYGGNEVLRSLALNGWLGVNFFFVLSGFIILHAHHQDLGRPERAGRYLRRRFVRLYPIYWIVLAAYLTGAFLGLGHSSFERSAVNLASAFLLVKLNEPMTLPLQVAWTLFYELTFYAIFTIGILHRTLGLAVLALWTAAILWNGFVIGDSSMGPLHMWNIYFLVGAAMFVAARRTDGRWGFPLIAAGLVALVVLVRLGGTERIYEIQGNAAMLLALTAPFALLLLGCVLAERAHGWRPRPALMLLGAASYAIYLVHSPTISVIAILNQKLAPGLLPPLLLFSLTAAASVAAGVVAHLVIEKPLLSGLRRWSDGERRPALPKLDAEPRR